MRRLVIVLLLSVVTAGSAMGAIAIPSDGSDGAFNPASNVTVDLSSAQTGTWSDNNSAHMGAGIYDPQKWAVVFKYSSVNIPAGVTVTFKNREPNAPVVWLVQGDVTIAGTVNLDGANSTPDGTNAIPGPGGFRGGASMVGGSPSGCGFGPGASGDFGGGSYGSQATASGTVYGCPGIIPLIGGSGGTGYAQGKGGGAGGGAVLIAASGTITITGSVTARGSAAAHDGWWPCGSGGAIRLVADTLDIPAGGRIDATGGFSTSPGGAGRIRIDVNQSTLVGTRSPDPTGASPGSTPIIWPEDSPVAVPTLRIVAVGNRDLSAIDPKASFDFPRQDVMTVSGEPLTVRMHATDMPTDWHVRVRVTPRTGPAVVADAARVSGDQSSSIWEASITLTTGTGAIQARASKD